MKLYSEHILGLKSRGDQSLEMRQTMSVMRRSKRRCNIPLLGIIGAFAIPDVAKGQAFVVGKFNVVGHLISHVRGMGI